MDNTENTINSCDVLKRLKELQEEYDGLHDAYHQAETEEQRKEAEENLDNYKQEFEWDEICTLREFVENAEEYVNLDDGVTFISDSYFVDHAMELAEDCGLEFPNQWPYNHINWDNAADALKQDYKNVNFGGVTYWVRA